MIPKSKDIAGEDEFIAGVEAAMRRAALNARKEAAWNNTPLIIFENGKIVRKMISMKDIEEDQ